MLAGYARVSTLDQNPELQLDALRNCFITVADRELMLPTSLTKRLVNHAPSNDVTEGYAADWTMAQLRDAAQRIADRSFAVSAAST
ncbi:MAG: hypothetical protein OXC26_04560 [Albidovulum sp.]|nr:hypothetical protein [Albidovulum sp.]